MSDVPLRTRIIGMVGVGLLIVLLIAGVYSLLFSADDDAPASSSALGSPVPTGTPPVLPTTPSVVTSQSATEARFAEDAAAAVADYLHTVVDFDWRALLDDPRALAAAEMQSYFDILDRTSGVMRADMQRARRLAGPSVGVPGTSVSQTVTILNMENRGVVGAAVLIRCDYTIEHLLVTVDDGTEVVTQRVVADFAVEQGSDQVWRLSGWAIRERQILH